MENPDFDFAEELAAIFAALAEKQEPLGEEFEAVLMENLDDLYEA